MAFAASGQQFVISAGDQHATIVEVGGGIRDYRVGDRDVLQLRAATRILTDPERELPAGTKPVDGTSFDFRSARRLGDLAIDYAFTDLERVAAARAWVRLGRPDGCTAELWVDETFPVIELYTADALSPGRRRRGLGTEPMSCPPNAFQTGQHVTWLEPGESVTTTWGARLCDSDVLCRCHQNVTA